ncbi:MAG: hypothetical protein QOI80_523, partial [Solirubrobacteraceae bacterium]|nr:hypothetical protein [Solirubrobacteraceae bacterium]
NSIKLALRGVAVNDSNVRSDIARKSIKLRRH